MNISNFKKNGVLWLNFCVNNILISGDWFVGKNSVNYFADPEGMDLLVTYLNLHRFMRHDSEQEEKLFLFSINELRKEILDTGLRRTNEQIFKLLIRLEKIKVLDAELHSERYKEYVKAEDLTYKKSKSYMSVPLDVVNYILSKGLSYRHVAFFLLCTKFSNNVENKAYFSINTAADYLGFSNVTVTKVVKELSQIQVLGVVKKKNSQTRRNGFEYYPLKSMSNWNQFKAAHMKNNY